MNDYLLQTKSFLEETMEKAKTDLLNAAISGDFEATQEISVTIQKIEQMKNFLGGNTSQEEFEELIKKQAAAGINRTTGRYRSNPTSENIEVLPMTSDLTNKKPLSVTIFNETHLTNSFRAVAENVCRALYEHDADKFNQLEDNPSVNGDKHKYFSKSEENEMSDPAIIGSGHKSMYVDVAKLAINNLFFLKRVVVAMGCNPNEVMISIDPSFVRKPREKKNK